MEQVGYQYTYFLLLISVKWSQQKVSESRFLKSSICNVNGRLRDGCSREIGAVRSAIPCISQCDKRETCIGASIDDAGKCYIHDLCLSLDLCDGPDPKHTYWASFCVHGAWDSQSESCKCFYASWGTRCDKYPTNCDSLIFAGYPLGRYLMFIDPYKDGRLPLRVMCYINPPALYHSVEIILNKGGINFNRTWREYENGFSMDEENHWAGLKNWKALSDAGFNKIVQNLVFKGDTKIYVYCIVFDVAIYEANNNFYMSYLRSSPATRGPVPGPYVCGDCFDTMEGLPFSTWDNDNDGDQGQNCASRAGFGWWFNGCDNPCSLLGWGLEDWENTPTSQRFSMSGVDMDKAHSQIEWFVVYLRK